MIILPDRHAPVGRLLLPQRKNEWRTPSLAQRKDLAGNENQTRFRLTARLHDGFIMWRGWFDGREDADAFLYAMVTGSLVHEPALWDLPTPGWRTDLGEQLSYDFATVTFVTATGSSTYTVPADWNSGSNTIETIGAGGSPQGSGSRIQGGGAGGAYSGIANLSLSVGASITVKVGAASASTAGGDTWFNGASLAASSVGSKGGGGTTSTTGGTGGAAASGIGTTKFSGGNGGTASSFGGAGGGGAGGPSGNGAAGGTNTGTPASGGGGSNGGSAGATGATNGGAGGNGVGGTGGGAGGGTGVAGTAGTAGTGAGGGGGGSNNGGGQSATNGGAGATSSVWTTAGPGGGGGGSGDGNNAGAARSGGAGGVYGGGGGGTPDDPNVSGGLGGQGLVVITYTPRVGSFGLALLGM